MTQFPQDDDQRILAEAAQWLTRIQTGGKADRAALRRWLAERPEHVAAMDLVERSWAMAPAAARAGGHLSRRPTARTTGQALSRRAPIAALCTAAVAALLWFGSVHDRVYQTGPHERRMVMLADGSRAWLAPSTRLSVHMSPLTREATLQGEAAFDVDHQWRGFRVDAGDVRTVDVGTLFSIRDRGPRVSVLLARGGIAIRDASTGQLLATPAPGERVDVEGRDIRVTRTDARDALAWRDGFIVARDQPLSTVIARFADQGAPPIRLADPAIGTVRLSGRYAVDDVQHFLDAVAVLYPVSWKRSGDGYEVRARP